MKIKKIVAVVAAAVMALGMTTMAFAGMNSTTAANSSLDDNGMLIYDVLAAGEIGATQATITFTGDVTDGFGGGIMFNGTTCGWSQSESNYWGNEGQPIIAEPTGNDNEYSMTVEIPEGTFTDADEYAQICVQQWWGAGIDITAVTLGDGAAAEEVAADDTAAETATVDKTADVPVAGIIVIALAGCAAVAFAMKKRFA